jgi:hypothetical protein
VTFEVAGGKCAALLQQQPEGTYGVSGSSSHRSFVVAPEVFGAAVVLSINLIAGIGYLASGDQRPSRPSEDQDLAAGPPPAVEDLALGTILQRPDQPDPEFEPIAQPETSAHPIPSGIGILPAAATARVVLAVPRDGTVSALYGETVRDTLAAAGIHVVRRIDMDTRTTKLAVGYYFRSDRAVAIEIGRRLEHVFGPVDPIALQLRGEIPQPGTVEVVVPGLAVATRIQP